MKGILHCIFVLILLSACGTSTNPIPPDQLPEGLPGFQVLVNAGDVFSGYIQLRKTASPGAHLMINEEGQVVWYHLADTTILRPHMPYAKSYLALLTGREIHEISYRGDTLLKLQYGDRGFDRPLHHEIIKDQDGNILGLTKETIPIDFSSVGGEVEDTLVTDGILKLSPSGEKLWHWRLNEVLDPLAHPDILKKKKDWGHANALAIDVDGNYLISWRDFNAIWKIDRKTGQLLWRHGPEDIAEDQHRFYQQHAIHRNLEGDYLILDNGHARERRTTRALAFRRQGDDMITTLSIALPDSLFTFKQGSVYQISKDRFLFSSTMTQTLVVTDREGQILWLAKSDQGFYRAYHVDRETLH